MKKEQVLNEIRQTGLVPVIRGSNENEVQGIVEQCLEAGLKVAELTFTIPFAHRVIENIASKYKDKIIVGAGSVLDSETARIAILSGAEFVVSPCFNPEVIKTCNRYRIASAAGIMTVTEAVDAMTEGADILKLFPGDAFGPSFIKALKGPVPQAEIMPTGGVDFDNAAEWIKVGAFALGVGSNLTKGNVKENAERYLDIIKKARSDIK